MTPPRPRYRAVHGTALQFDSICRAIIVYKWTP